MCIRWVIVTAIVTVMLCANGAEPSVNPNEKYISDLYDKISWNEGVPNPDETQVQIDVKRVQGIIKSNKNLLWKGCTVLCAVKNPSQLDFLVALLTEAQNRTEFSGQSGLGRYISAQVRSDDDVKKLEPLLAQNALFPELLFAIRNTMRDDLVKKAYQLQFADAHAQEVNEFISYRLDHNLSTGPATELSQFLKASVRKKDWRDGGAWQSGILAARLGQKWIAEWLIKSIREIRDFKGEDELDRIFRLDELLAGLSDVSMQDFGKKHPIITDITPDNATRAEVMQRVDKSLTWWKTAASDKSFQIDPK